MKNKSEKNRKLEKKGGATGTLIIKKGDYWGL